MYRPGFETLKSSGITRRLLTGGTNNMNRVNPATQISQWLLSWVNLTWCDTLTLMWSWIAPLRPNAETELGKSKNYSRHFATRKLELLQICYLKQSIRRNKSVSCFNLRDGIARIEAKLVWKIRDNPMYSYNVDEIAWLSWATAPFLLMQIDIQYLFNSQNPWILHQLMIKVAVCVSLFFLLMPFTCIRIFAYTKI